MCGWEEEGSCCWRSYKCDWIRLRSKVNVGVGLVFMFMFM
jgi:hypothetical protein